MTERDCEGPALPWRLISKSLSARISLQQRGSRRIVKAGRSQMSTLVDCLLWQVWSALEVAREMRLSFAVLIVLRCKVQRLRSDSIDAARVHHTDLTRWHVQDCLMCP